MGREKKYQAIYNWSEYERSRKRLLKFGPDKLSDIELLTVLLFKDDTIKE